MQKTFEEFKQEVQHNNGQKKITGSWGVYDCYKHIRKNGWYGMERPIKEKEFYAIVRGVNSRLAEELSTGNPVVLPLRMGTLELRKGRRGASIVNGELKVNYPIDWKRTIALWYEDPEAYKNRTLLRHEEGWVYTIKYAKDKAKYENKFFYQFAVNTFIKRALKDNIKQGKIDALWEQN